MNASSNAGFTGGFDARMAAYLRATDRANKYIAETAPFTLAKKPEAMPRVGTILRNLADALLATGRLAAPFLPDTGAKILDLLNADPSPGWRFPAAHAVKPSAVLFPRIEARR